MPLPPPLVIGFLSRFLLSVSDSFTPPLLSALLASLLLAELDRHGISWAHLWLVLSLLISSLLLSRCRSRCEVRLVFG
jgi:hypothetical protein